MGKVVAMLTVVLFVAGIFSSVSAEEETGKVGFVSEDKIINTNCPVMGGAVDDTTPYKVEYEGKIVGFCCPNCIGKFNAEPEKYMTSLKKNTITCPKCGAEIDITQICEERKKNKGCPMAKDIQSTEED
jgi:YHS domain-containing protein